jgi:hypothetical protein
MQIQGPMGPDIVMAIFILGKLLVVLSDIERDVLDFVKLFSMGPVTPLHPSVELRVTRRIKEQQDLGSSTSLFELIHEL